MLKDTDGIPMGVTGKVELLNDKVIAQQPVVSLDWKFGDGVPVDATENAQGMYYVAAARRTPGLEWVFDGAKEVEIVIVQPPHIRRWVTTFDRINAFEQELMLAMYEAKKPNAKLQHGEHCRFCSAKPVCPVMTGAVDRALKVKVDSLDHAQINAYLKNADMLEDWITSLRDLAYNLVKGGATLPDWKLVAKRGTRKWADEGAACVFLINSIGTEKAYTAKIISPAQAEKELKKVMNLNF
jgi:hypothetical protein